jgi:acetyl-CoA acetyltransferase
MDAARWSQGEAGPREGVVEEVADAAIKAGLDGTLSWAQVDGVLMGLGYGEEPEAVCGTRPVGPHDVIE